MRNLARFSLHNRSLITLLAIVSAVFGVLALGGMRQDLVPAIASSSVSIVTSYESATPTVVDSEVSQVIETIVESVDGLVSTTTYSGNGLSLVTAEFELGLDTEAVLEEVSKKLSENSALLPKAVKPQVDAASIDDFPVMQFAVGTGDAALTTALQDSISQRLEGVAGVREARFTGVPSDQMVVELDAEKAEDLGIGVRDVQAAIVSGGMVEASGAITEGERTFNVQSGKAIADIKAIEALPVAVPDTDETVGFGGMSAPTTPKTVTVGEVATVQHLIPGASLISRVDGAPTVVLLISKIPNANTVDLSADVQAEMADIDEEFDLDSSLIFDQSPYIQKSVETLAVEGLIGLLCAVIVVFFFLTSIRTTLVTAVSIPSSLLLAAIAMQFADFTINMITLAALTVAVGRVVDDSIVVVESIERELLITSDRVAAIVNGVSSVAGAVLSSTLTTVAVFLPIAFIGGTIGELFRPFALTAAAALLASLVVSLTIIPVLAYWFVRPRLLTGTSVRFDERVRSRLDGFYRPLIGRALARPWRIVAFSLVVLVGTAALLPGLSTGYLSSLGDTQIRVLQKLDPSTSVDAQKKKADVIEKALMGVDGIERVQTSIGSSGSIIQDASLGGGDGIASYLLATPEGADQTALIDEVRDTLEALPEYDTLGELDYSVTTDMEFASGIEIGISAVDDASLSETVSAVTEKIEGLDVVADTESTLANTVERLDVKVDAAKALKHGMTEQEIRDAVHDALSSTEAGSMVVDGDTIDILVLPGRTIASTDDLKRVEIDTPLSGDEPLSEFASIEKAAGPVVLQSRQGLRYAVITVEPRSDDLGATSEALASAIDDIDLPSGSTVDLGGSVTARVDAFEQMGVVSLIAILIVYTIMVATFRSLVQPLLLLVAIPFAVTGGALIQRITGEPFGVPSLIGSLMLVGIVVTNSIVLIDLVNQRRAEGVPLRDAIIDGASRRLRPILMTAAATVFALVPMAVGLTTSSAFISRPLGLVVIGGMASSTLLTLVVLPVLYFLLERWREQNREKRAEQESDEGGLPRYRRSADGAATLEAAESTPKRGSGNGSGAPHDDAPDPTLDASPPSRSTRVVRVRRRGAGPRAPKPQAPARAPWRAEESRPRRVVPASPRREHASPAPVSSPAPATHAPADVGLERTMRLAPPREPTPSTESHSTASMRPAGGVLPAVAPPAMGTTGTIGRATAGLLVPEPRGGGLTTPPSDTDERLRRRRTGEIPTLPQYVSFAQDEERLDSATVRTWWTSGTSGRRPLLMLDPFTPHSAGGVGVAEPVRSLAFSGTTLSPEQFDMVRSLSRLLDDDLHGYAYFAAQLVLWEIMSPVVEAEIDVAVPAADADLVAREFESLYERMLRTRVDSRAALWVVTPTTPAEPRMIVRGLD